jgi:hypothetical protein
MLAYLFFASSTTGCILGVCMLHCNLQNEWEFSTIFNDFQRFSTADLYQFTTGTPELFLLILHTYVHAWVHTRTDSCLFCKSQYVLEWISWTHILLCGVCVCVCVCVVFSSSTKVRMLGQCVCCMHTLHNIEICTCEWFFDMEWHEHGRMLASVVCVYVVCIHYIT